MPIIGRIAVVAGLFLFALTLRAEEEWPPRRSDFTIPMMWGPEGIGGGIGYYFRDLAGKKHRDLLLHDLFTNTAYTQCLVDFEEPDFIFTKSKLSLRYLYLHRTGVHFFGIGNDTEPDAAGYYGAEIYLGRAGYELRFGPNLGLSGGAEYHRTALHDGRLTDPDFQPGHRELERPFSEAFPRLFDSDDFRFREFTSNWFVTLFHDNADRPVFPTRGGYERARVIRVDRKMGADWNYWHYTAEAAHFFTLTDAYNILGGYLRWDRLDGRQLPFWEYPALGHARLNLSHYLEGFGLRGYWENRFQEQNRALGSLEYRHRTRAEWFPADKFNFGQERSQPGRSRPKWLPEEKPLGQLLHEFLLNSSALIFVDAGQTWGDHDPPRQVRLTPGFGYVFYFNSGIAMRATIGFSDELFAYQVWVDWQAF